MLQNVNCAGQDFSESSANRLPPLWNGGYSNKKYRTWWDLMRQSLSSPGWGGTSGPASAPPRAAWSSPSSCAPPRSSRVCSCRTLRSCWRLSKSVLACLRVLQYLLPYWYGQSQDKDTRESTKPSYYFSKQCPGIEFISCGKASLPSCGLYRFVYRFLSWDILKI